MTLTLSPCHAKIIKAAAAIRLPLSKYWKDSRYLNIFFKYLVFFFFNNLGKYP